MKAIAASVPRTLNIGSQIKATDNSGAKLVRIVSIIRGKGTKGRQMSCRLADLVKVSVKQGQTEMRKKIFFAVVVRQKKEFRRKTGERISFEDNAVVLLKDRDGNPKGTQIKGPIAREIVNKWPFVAKLATMVV